MMTPSDALDRLQITLNCSEVSLSETIQLIQLDAAKWGAEQAEKVVSWHHTATDERELVRKAILTFSNTLTIDQLPK